MRKTILTTLPLLLLAAGCAHDNSGSESRSSRGETELAEALEGRTAGEPIRCIRQRDIRSARVYEGTAVLYTLNNGKLYLNRPDSGAQALRENDVMVTDTRTPDLCSMDTVRLFARSTGIFNGFINLGPFVPYEEESEDRPASTSP